MAEKGSGTEFPETDLDPDLVSFASWQDSLLQSYRSLYFSVELTMLGVLASFLLFRLSADDAFIGSLIDVVLILGLFLVRGLFSYLVANVIESRSGDVDYWHREILSFEKGLPQERRKFSKFKAWQRNKDEEFDPDLSVDDLMGKGTGHTRTIFNLYIPAVLWLFWTAILILLFNSLPSEVVA